MAKPITRNVRETKERQMKVAARALTSIELFASAVVFKRFCPRTLSA